MPLPQRLNLPLTTLRTDAFRSDFIFLTKKSWLDNDELEEALKCSLKGQIAKKLGYQDLSSLKKRITKFSNLEDVIREPGKLAIALQCLPYMEAFYAQNDEPYLKLEVIYKDLMHFMSVLLIQDLSLEIALQYKGLSTIGDMTVQEGLLKYYCAVASFINKHGKEMEEYAKHSSFERWLDRISDTGTEKLYQRLFHPKVHLFEKEDLYSVFYLGLTKNIFFTQGHEDAPQFTSRDMLDYFATLNIDSDRRAKIQSFCEKTTIGEELKPHITEQTPRSANSLFPTPTLSNNNNESPSVTSAFQYNG